MVRKYSIGMKFIIIALLLVTLFGCATIRYLDPPIPPPADSGLRASSEDVELTLHYLINPDGLGSWVRGAKWNEFVVSLKLNQGVVTIERISLINIRGAFLSSFVRPEQGGNDFSAVYNSQAVGSLLGLLLNGILPTGVRHVYPGTAVPAVGAVLPTLSIFGKSFGRER